MPGKNKTPLLGWHPPADLGAWVRAEAQRRGVAISVILNEAVQAARDAASHESSLENSQLHTPVNTCRVRSTPYRPGVHD